VRFKIFQKIKSEGSTGAHVHKISFPTNQCKLAFVQLTKTSILYIFSARTSSDQPNLLLSTHGRISTTAFLCSAPPGAPSESTPAPPQALVLPNTGAYPSALFQPRCPLLPGVVPAPYMPHPLKAEWFPNLSPI
jgi:hypothetical protein